MSKNQSRNKQDKIVQQEWQFGIRFHKILI